MKNTLLVLLSLIMIVSCSNSEVVVLESDLVLRDGLYYEPFSSSPADGIYEIYFKNGQLKERQTVKNGKLDGLYEDYYENGQLWVKQTYKDGTIDGISEYYKSDGTLSAFAKKVEKPPEERDGLYYEYLSPNLANGQLETRQTYKGGELEGLWEDYFESGALFRRMTFKDGKLDGLWENCNTVGKLLQKCFYENGTKSYCE